MKFIALLLIGVGIGYLLASDDTSEIISNLKDGFLKGKDYLSDKLDETAENISSASSHR